MAEKNANSENFNRRDLDLILEVNRKAIEIETAVADQNEEIISILNKSKERDDKEDQNLNRLEDKIDKLIKQSEETNKDIFKIQVLFMTGLLSLIIQVIQFLFKK